MKISTASCGEKRGWGDVAKVEFPQGVSRFGSEIANPDQVKAELPVGLSCEGHYRKICIDFKINESLLYFFKNGNIFLALLVRITCLGVLNSISETQLKLWTAGGKQAPWRTEVFVMPSRTYLKKRIRLFCSHVPPHPRITTERTLEKHVLLQLHWPAVQGSRGFWFLATYRDLCLPSSLPCLLRKPGAISETSAFLPAKQCLLELQPEEMVVSPFTGSLAHCFSQ